MEIRNVGRSGLRVSIIGLGGNNFGERINLETTRKVIDKALDLGVNFIDTADMYAEGRSEEIIGKVLGPRRHQVVIASKFSLTPKFPAPEGGPYGSRSYIVSAVEASLKRLGTDWIDLYLYHMNDARTPLEESLRAVDDLVRQGKVRYVGLSNHPGWQVVEADWTAKAHHLHPPISCQDPYSLLEREPERELIPAIRAHGLGLIPYFPLAGGLLTGKYKKGASLSSDTRFGSKEMGGLGGRFLTDRNWAIVQKLEGFASSRGHTLLELAFSWLAANPVVSTIIAGATTAAQIEKNVAAANWKLTPEDLAQVDQIAR